MYSWTKSFSPRSTLPSEMVFIRKVSPTSRIRPGAIRYQEVRFMACSQRTVEANPFSVLFSGCLSVKTGFFTFVFNKIGGNGRELYTANYRLRRLQVPTREYWGPEVAS